MSEFAEIWLARHGETEWSLAKRHTGATNLPLTAAGGEQAGRLGTALAGESFARVLCSPRLRARQTCERAGLIERAELRDELAEWDYGDYEGKTTVEIQAQRPGWLLWRDGAPGGESPGEVAERIDPLIAELREPREAVVVFSHGHLLRMLAARWIEQEPPAGQRLPLATATVSRLGYEHDYPVIRAWNCPPAR